MLPSDDELAVRIGVILGGASGDGLITIGTLFKRLHVLLQKNVTLCRFDLIENHAKKNDPWASVDGYKDVMEEIEIIRACDERLELKMQRMCDPKYVKSVRSVVAGIIDLIDKCDVNNANPKKRQQNVIVESGHGPRKKQKHT